tara:strand:- start:672 stop:836 length:165 start_codon:yes stop_codon:yes gene_type:complete
MKPLFNEKELAFLELAKEYKQKYENTPWWKFKKRMELKKSWKSAIECMCRYGKH